MRHKLVMVMLSVALIVSLTLTACVPEVVEEEEEEEVPAVEKYPFEEPICAIVAYSPGGGTDIMARQMLPFLEKELGTSMYIKNLPGASAEIGFTALATAKPDGYTIGIINMPGIAIRGRQRGSYYMPLLEHYDTIGINVYDPGIVIVRRDDPRFPTLNALVDYVKAHPGKVILGSMGPLSDDHLALSVIETALGLEFAYIPYKDTASAVTALMGEETDVMLGNVSELFAIEERCKALATLWPERAEALPDVPTFKEETGVEIVSAGSRGWVAPAGTPPDRLTILREAFYKVATSPEYVEDAKTRGISIAKVRGGDEFSELILGLDEVVDKAYEYFKARGYIE